MENNRNHPKTPWPSPFNSINELSLLLERQEDS